MPFSLKFPWKIPPEDPVSGRLEPFYAAAKVQSRAACCSKKTTAVPLERSLFSSGKDIVCEMPTIQSVQYRAAVPKFVPSTVWLCKAGG